MATSRSYTPKLLQHKELIEKLFLEEDLQIVQIARQLTELGCKVGRVKLRDFISKTLGLTRPKQRKQHHYNPESESKLKTECSFCGRVFGQTGPWQKRCRACIPTHRAGMRFQTHGIVESQFQAMIVKCNNCCEICHKQFGDGRKEGPHVDHDHTTGKIRGLLCAQCNVKLAGLDDKSWRDSAFTYLGLHGLAAPS